jgi:solute:Na+ symporter, SSS family
MPGIGRMILGDSAHEGFGGLVTDPAQGWGIPFMLVGPIIAVLCVVIYIIVSLLTPAMDEAAVSKVCWDHPLAFLKGPLAGLSDPRLVTLALMATVGVLYYLLR